MFCKPCRVTSVHAEGRRRRTKEKKKEREEKEEEQQELAKDSMKTTASKIVQNE